MYFFKVSRKIIVVLDQIFLRYNIKITLKKWLRVSTSLVAQWIRVCLPMQETGVQSLIHIPQLLKPMHLEPVLHKKRQLQREARAPRTREQLLLSTARESHCVATKTQLSQRYINKK